MSALDKTFVYFSVAGSLYSSVNSIIRAYRKGPVSAERLEMLVMPAVMAVEQAFHIEIREELITALCQANVKAVEQWAQ